MAFQGLPLQTPFVSYKKFLFHYFFSIFMYDAIEPLVKSEPLIRSTNPWGHSFQDKIGRFNSLGAIRPKYRRSKPSNLFQTLLYEYDRNQSAYLTSCVLPKGQDEAHLLVPGAARRKEFTATSIALAWASLLIGVIAISCVGSFIQKMGGVNGLLKSIWFTLGMNLLFALSAAANVVVRRISQTKPESPSIDTDYVCSKSGIAIILMAGVGSGIGSGCWTMSLNYTSVAQSYLFNSLHPQLILLARASQMLPVFWEEIFGILLALGGCGMSFFGSQSSAPGGSRILLGDGLAFISSISQALGLMINKSVVPHMSSALFLCFITSGSLITQLLAAVISFRGQLTLFGPHDGILGFVDPAYFPWWLASICCICVAQYGQMVSLRVLSPIVVSILLTLQPFLATAIQVVVLRAGTWPPALSLVGNLVLIAGSFLVCWASRYHTVADEVPLSIHSEDEDEG